MKTVTALAEQLGNALTFREKYPLFNLKDQKIHVLFLSPCLNETGYYRMILPALELNKTDTHSAIIAHIHKWDYNKLFDDYDHPVSIRLVKWADYVVLPSMFSDVSYIIESFRAVNSDIDFVMDLDLNYHALPDYHPHKKVLTSEAKATLLNNLSLVDVVTAPNMTILRNYLNLAHSSPKMFEFSPENFGNLVSNFAYDDITEIHRNPGVKVRIGILLDGFFPEDLRTIEDALLKVLAENKDMVELVIYGWNDKMRARYGILKDIEVEFKQIVNTNVFHTYLNELTIDIGLIPFVNNVYNRSGRAFNRLLDFSGLMIPSVMPSVAPFTGCIKDGENGFLARTSEEWYDKMTRLIHDAELRISMGQLASAMVWQSYSYVNVRATERLKEIFE